MNAILLLTLAVTAVVAVQGNPTGQQQFDPFTSGPPPQAQPMDQTMMLLMIAMMNGDGDSKMSTILPILLLSQPGGQSNMTMTMMMMMMNKKDKKAEAKPAT